MVNTINEISLDIIGLFRNNYLSEFHIRKMAKLIDKTHVALLPHLKEFEKIKILTPKEIGKTKVYSLNLENRQLKEYLSLSEKKKTIDSLNQDIFLKKFYEEIFKTNFSCSLVLFGKYILDKNSDEIDLLYMDDLNEIEKRKIKEIGNRLGKKINLLAGPLNHFRNHLIKQSQLINDVVNNHIILCNHDVFINELWNYYLNKKR